ncbi:MAG: hypothetical protein AB8F94_03085 [Saprospiraceae bacterium]
MKKILFCILTCFIFSSCSNEDAQRLLDEQSKSLESGFELIEKDLIQLRKEVSYELSSEAKQKYRPIKDWIEKTVVDFSKIYDWIKEREKLLEKDSFSLAEESIEMDSLLKELKLIQGDDFSKIMSEHGKIFGLRENEIIEWIEQNEIKLIIIDSISKMFLENKNHLEVSKNILCKVKFDLKVLEKKLVGRVAELMGGRLIVCNFGIFPRVFPSQDMVRRGDVFKAEIMIHPYDHGISLSDLEFKIDGKIIDFNGRRVINYVSEPIKGKQKTFIISCKFKSEISGKFETAFPDYEYIINTIE